MPEWHLLWQVCVACAGKMWTVFRHDSKRHTCLSEDLFRYWNNIWAQTWPRHFANNRKFRVVIHNDEPVCIVEEEHVCTNHFQRSAWYFMRQERFVLLRWLVFLADVTWFDCGLDVTIDVYPVHGVFRSESSLIYAEMTLVQPVPVWMTACSQGW